ncbi:MAG: hypothetical protein EBT86_13235 [Actinobacteria bacterium]|nr:hypothetical protein [Actinomycetota bacterium]
MENKRYNFGGYSFGEKGLAVLNVQVLNHTENGTTYSTEISLELTPDERVELITNLIRLNEKDAR